MERDQAIFYALNGYPDIPGVGRLCQELLSEITGQPITTATPEPVQLEGVKTSKEK